MYNARVFGLVLLRLVSWLGVRCLTPMEYLLEKRVIFVSDQSVLAACWAVPARCLVALEDVWSSFTSLVYHVGQQP